MEHDPFPGPVFGRRGEQARTGVYVRLVPSGGTGRRRLGVLADRAIAAPHVVRPTARRLVDQTIPGCAVGVLFYGVPRIVVDHDQPPRRVVLEPLPRRTVAPARLVPREVVPPRGIGIDAVARDVVGERREPVRRDWGCCNVGGIAGDEGIEPLTS